MILQKMPHYVDSILTQEDASAALQDGQVVERGFQSVVQIAALDDELHIVALRGDVRHEMIHSFVGGDAEKARLFHFQALRVSLLLGRNSKIKQKGS